MTEDTPAPQPAPEPLPPAVGGNKKPPPENTPPEELAAPVVYESTDDQPEPVKPVTYDAAELAAAHDSPSHDEIEDLSREAAGGREAVEAIPLVAASRILPSPVADGLVPTPDVAPLSAADLTVEPLPSPATAAKSAAEAVSETAVAVAAAALPSPVAAKAPKPQTRTNMDPSPPPATGPERWANYRPVGYPIGGPPKMRHLLVTMICVLLLLGLAGLVVRELIAPSRPMPGSGAAEQIGPPLPGAPQAGEPEPILRQDGLFEAPSALNENFESPQSARDFVHYQEGRSGPVLTADGLALAASPAGADGSHGRHCLSVQVQFPLESGAWKNVDFSTAPEHPGYPIGPAAAVLFEVYVPADMSGNIKAAFHIKDRHGAWYQTESRNRLIPGRWNTVFADLRPQSGLMRPVGHGATLDHAHLSRASGYGFSFYGDEPLVGRVYLDNIRVLAGAAELPEIVAATLAVWRGAQAADDKLAARRQLDNLRGSDRQARWQAWPPMAVTNLSENCDPPPRCFEPLEVQFNLTRGWYNPYDPEQVEVWALLRPNPSGTAPTEALPETYGNGRVVSGFYLQPAEAAQEFGRDRYDPADRGQWAFRFTPRAPGAWRYALVVVDRRLLGQKLALTLDEMLGGAGAGGALDPDGPEALARRELAATLGRELENRLRAAVVKPVLDPFLGVLAELGRADTQDREAYLSACAGALQHPDLGWLRELLEKGVPGGAEFATKRERYTAQLLADAVLVTGWRSLGQVEPPAAGQHGFVRVSPQDGRYFEFEDGTFFYPIGHNLRSPTDPRGAMILSLPETRDRGLNTYREFFQKMRANGENFCEIWMSSWFLDIEWTRRWPGYYGLTRYNQIHAARLDALLELAAQYGIKLHFVLENHGKFSDWCDPEWSYSPYREELGGGDLSPMEFFSDPQARDIYRKKLRYIVARWAHHPAIAGIEMVSEFDLTGTAGNPNNPHGDRHSCQRGAQLDWLKAMIEEWRRIDPYQHPVTNHYATGIQFIDWNTARDVFDYVVGDVYTDHKPQVSFLNHAIVFALRHRDGMDGKLKPFLITEYGGDWSGASPSQLAGDLRAGIWSGWMTGSAGTPLLWWFDLIEQENLYRMYRPFALFIAGEDPRGLDLKARIYTAEANLGYNKNLYAPNSNAPTGPNADKLDYIVRLDWSEQNGGNATRGYGWILDREQLSDLPFRDNQIGGRRSYKDIRLVLANLQPGDYAVECWDTEKGAVIETLKVTVAAQPGNGLNANELLIPFPAFTLDLAFKLKPWQEPLPPPPATATPAPTPASQPERSAPAATQPRER